MSPASGEGKKKDPGNEIEAEFGTTKAKSNKIWTQTIYTTHLHEKHHPWELDHAAYKTA